MRLSDLAGLVLWSLRSRPGRTLAIISVLASGLSAAVLAATVITGFGAHMDRIAFGPYSRALVIRENIAIADRHGPPEIDDLHPLRTRVPGAQGAAAWAQGFATTIRNGRTYGFAVFGVRGDYRAELDSDVAAGRLLSSDEVHGLRPTCLVGSALASRLGGSRLVGADIRVNGATCRVVGILGPPRSRPADRFRNAVIMPFAAAVRYVLTDEDRALGTADWLTVFVGDNVRLNQAGMEADLLLRKRHGVRLSEPSPYILAEDLVSVARVEEQRSLLSSLLVVVGAISTLAGLIGYAAISSAFVASRNREFALRLTMGADKRDLVLQVLSECLVTGLLGGLLGVTVGAGLGYFAARRWDWPFALDGVIAVGSAALGTLIGALIGAWLAQRAAGQPPALAARTA